LLSEIQINEASHKQIKLDLNQASQRLVKGYEANINRFAKKKAKYEASLRRYMFKLSGYTASLIKNQTPSIKNLKIATGFGETI